MAKGPDLPSGKTPATKVDGHKIQQPRLLDEKHEREVTERNEEAVREAPAEEEEETKDSK